MKKVMNAFEVRNLMLPLTGYVALGYMAPNSSFLICEMGLIIASSITTIMKINQI